MRPRVLVADDEPLTAEMLALMLAFRGFEVVCVHDGAAALRRAKEFRPDVLLLDVCMPELEGDVVTRLVRQDPDLAEVPVVIVSSLDEEEVDWRDAGADIYLRKPIDIRRLPEVVAGLLAVEEPPPQAA
jgi:DNA-binding response OmpR family regulator